MPLYGVDSLWLVDWSGSTLSLENVKEEERRGFAASCYVLAFANNKEDVETPCVLSYSGVHRMNVDVLDQDIERLLRQRKWLMILSGALLISNLLSGFIVLSKREQVILVPPHFTKSLKFQGSEVSKEYLEEFSIYLTMIFLDLSPSSFSYHHDILLKYVTPESYGSLKKKLLKDGEQYKKLQLSTNFQVSQVTADPKSLTVEVKGILTSYVAGKQVESTLESVVLEFTNRGGGLLLKQLIGGLSDEE